MDKKNGIIGIALLLGSFALMFWQGKAMKEGEAKVEQAVAAQHSSGALTQTTKKAASQEKSPIFRSKEEKQLQKKAVSQELEKIHTLENDYIIVKFTSRGAAIKSVELKKYPAVQGQPELYEFNKNSVQPALGFSYLTDTGELQAYNPQYEAVHIGAGQLLFKAVTPEGVEIYRGYSLSMNESTRDPYLIFHETKFVNHSEDTVDLKSLFLTVGAYPPTEGDSFGEYLNYGYYDGKDAEFIKIGQFHDSNGFLGMGGKKAVTEVYKAVRPVQWASVKNQFFTSVVTPKTPANGVYVSTTNLGEKDQFVEGLLGSMEFTFNKINAGEERLLDVEYYVGPKEYARLQALGQKQDLIMQFGFFRFVSQLLLVLMSWVHAFVPNWGFTIIIVTIIIKTILWPLTGIQVRSAKRMANIQQPLKELKEKFKDNPQRLQSETMKLFKENKVNPAAGCLPLLVQLPIFLGLYFMLRTASELRFAEFLWIKDLSLPDTIMHIAGFPLNILPLLMGVSMFWQMKSTPTPTTDNLQKKMFQLMPFIFLIFCYSFPAGLVLYWTVQNLLTILQQTVMKNMKDPITDVVVVQEKKGKGPVKGKRGNYKG